MRLVLKHDQDRKVGGPRARKLWRLVEVRMASRILGRIINAGAQEEA
jgi:hypothetical protein